MTHRLAPLLCCAVFAHATAAAAPADSAGVEFFEKKIRPVLVERCYECHSHQSQKLKAGLYLDSREGALKGGESGVALVVGEPDKSRFIEAVRYANADLQMPPKQKLPDDVIADLVEWVKLGAPWPKETAPAEVAKKTDTELLKRQHEHWAWQPVPAVKPPTVKNKAWPRSPMDNFILAELEKKNLKPAPAAEKRALVRRAYFDLIGLPPSPEEVETFVNDKSAAAFAKVVDHLLASPHYGERQARHWLDVARYGEDQAHSFQPRLYPQGWRYRDWLVRAFNHDLPYDRFIKEQIAGDLLEDGDRLERVAALGFFALGPVYYGDSKGFDQLDDRIDTLTRGFLGLTVACARCHDHKFDPIASRDYYGLAGVFASSEYLEAPMAPPDVVAAYDRAQAAIKEKAAEQDKFLEAEATRLAESTVADSARYVVAAWKLINQRKASAGKSAEALAKEAGLQSAALDRWAKYLTAPAKPEQTLLAPWHELLAAQDAKADLSAMAEKVAEVRKVAELIQVSVTAALKARDAKSVDKVQTALLEDLLGKDGVCAVSKKDVEKVMPDKSRARVAELKAEQERLKKDAPPKYPFAHSLKEGAKPADIPVLLRGNKDAPGDVAPRAFLPVLSGGKVEPFKRGSGRLELACAIADAKNPLTARVMVNRLWQHHFGTGLVRTASNFGTLGERPTHPALLDWLAEQFVQQGWSMKALHRTIMLSATYQMSNRFDARAGEVDGDNKLLWRMNRRRLEVEAWRDALLAAGGNLDRSVGGPSVSLASASNHRRTFYGTVSRHDLSPLLRLFDFPDPNVTSDARPNTTVPLQQLFVLNSEFMVAQSKALAARLTASADADDAGRIRNAFVLLYSRPPTERELKLGREFLASPEPPAAAKDKGTATTLTKWEQYAQALLSANEFMYVD